MKIRTLFFIALLYISSFGFAQSVTIGTQVWTTKNLDVATFRNGDAIPQAKTDEEWETAGKNSQLGVITKIILPMELNTENYTIGMR